MEPCALGFCPFPPAPKEEGYDPNEETGDAADLCNGGGENATEAG